MIMQWKKPWEKNWKKEQTEHKRHEKNVFDDLPDKDELQDKQEDPCQQEVSVDELKKPENVSQKMIEKKILILRHVKNRNHAENFGYFW